MSIDPKLELPAHIEILRSELESRQAVNPRYSLRGFADYLGLHPSALSRILKGKQPLSLESAVYILKKLKLRESDRLIFVSAFAQEKLLHICSKLSEAMEASDLVTERGVVASLKSAEGAARDRELVSFLTTPCWHIDLEGKIVRYNESFRTIFGVKHPNKHLVTDLMHSEEREGYLLIWDRARSAGTSFQYLGRLKTVDGSFQELGVRTMPLKTASREITGWLCIVDPQSMNQARSSNRVVG